MRPERFSPRPPDAAADTDVLARRRVWADQPLAVLFRDQRFVVLNKPAGLPVHGGPHGGPSVEDWLPALSRRQEGPWLAHRLDTDTAGCLVVALRKTPLLAAQGAFSGGLASKTYWAVVSGVVKAESGRIETKLLKRSVPRGWRMVIDAAGQVSITDWRVMGRSNSQTWLELSPRTGRTHQIRVHCASIGHPVLGDPIYGGLPGRLHLLARGIVLPLDPPLSATADPPAHMREALLRCQWTQSA